MEIVINGHHVRLVGDLSEKVTLEKLVDGFRGFEAGSEIYVDFNEVIRGNSVGLLTWTKAITQLGLTIIYQNAPIWLTEQFNMMDDLFACGSKAESIALRLYCQDDESHLIKVLKVGKEVPVLENYENFHFTYADAETGKVYEADFLEDELFMFIALHRDSYRHLVENGA